MKQRIEIYQPYVDGSISHPSNSDKDRVLIIVANSDGTRLSCNGGYPSEVAFIGDLVVWAKVDHDGGPSLTIDTIQHFIKAHKYIDT